MPRTRTRQQQLARSGPDELADAQAHLERLLSSAAVLQRAAAHDPDVAICDDAACRLPEVADGTELCSLADRLAGLHPGPPPAPEPLERAVERFRGAVVDALDAVRACRQTAHPVGSCWFAAFPDVDGCGEVLRIAHRSG
jgi:hypothetical protein